MDAPYESPLPAVEQALETNLLDFARFMGRSHLIELHDSEELTWLSASVPVAFANQVVRTSLTVETVDEGIAATIHFFERRKATLRWVVGPGSRPPGLAAALERRGFLFLGESSGMWAHVDRLPHHRHERDFRVARVSDTTTLRDCLGPLSRGHSLSQAAARFYLEVFESLGFEDRKPWWLFLGRAREEPVAMAALFLGRGVAGVYAVATVPEARRLGYGTSMTLAVLEEARKEGSHTAVLRSTGTTLSLYRRLGFRACGTFRDYLWTGR